jgi:nuclease-like protein
MRILLAGFKRTRPGPDDGVGMFPSVAAKDAFRQSAIRFLACLAALSVAGLALVITHPAWWPLSLVTAGSIPFLYHLAGLGRFRGTEPVAAGGAMERLGHAGYSIWHDVTIGERTVSHVVVGPTGVFAISRVTWSGRLELGEDGGLRHSRRDAAALVWEASRDAAAVKARLRAVGLRGVPVRALIAATRARISEGPLDFGQAILMRVADVQSYVLSGAPTLAPEQVARAIAAFEGEEPTERSRPGRG